VRAPRCAITSICALSQAFARYHGHGRAITGRLRPITGVGALSRPDPIPARRSPSSSSATLPRRRSAAFTSHGARSALLADAALLERAGDLRVAIATDPCRMAAGHTASGETGIVCHGRRGWHATPAPAAFISFSAQASSRSASFIGGAPRSIVGM
jgi:hypothetical protein